jgi:hypothetical protein
VHVGGALRAVDGPALVVEEALHADADPVGAGADDDGEPVRQRGLRRGLDGHRRAHEADLPHRAEDAIELAGVEQRRGAAADRRARDRERAALVERAPDHGGLALERGEVRVGAIGLGHGLREQVAEPAALLAERDVDIEEQRVAALAGPQRPERHRRIEPAIGGLVRVRVEVGLVRAGVEARARARVRARVVTGELRPIALGHPAGFPRTRGARPRFAPGELRSIVLGHSSASAYGTVVTSGCATRWPT